MSRRAFDAIVLGLGAMGSSALLHLARRGQRVLGIEQFDIAHNRGSSHGRSRMIRLAYYEHPDYVPLLRRAYQLWDELSADTGRALIHRTGGLYLGRLGSELIDGSLESARRHELPHDILSHDEVRRRFPQFSPEADLIGVFEPSAGLVLPEAAIAANVRLAEARGATVVTNEPVRGWSATGDGIEVTTDHGRYTTSALIIAGGAWMPGLAQFPGLSNRLRVTRQILTWFEPLRADLAIAQMPVWGIDLPGGGLFYGFPVHADDEGFKAAIHSPGEPADPDRLDRTLHPSDIQPVRECLDRWLPGAAGAPLRQCVCMYTSSPDGHFILDRHPAHANVLLASCCSGHGFKFAPVVGEALADLFCDGRTDLPIGFLGLSRFEPITGS